MENYLVNKTSTKVNSRKSLEELFIGHKPTLEEHFHIFGCEAFMHVSKEQRKKLDSKTIQCVLVGYDEQTKGY
jgi:hypothetical protein